MHRQRPDRRLRVPWSSATTTCNDVMGYQDAREIPNYWTYAKNFALQDNMFESAISWSLPGDRRLGHLLRQPSAEVLEVARVGRSGPRPLHRLRALATVRAAQPSQLALDEAPGGAEIQMPPALDAPVLDRQAACSAARARPRTPAQTDRHDHPLAAERHILDPDSLEPEHPVECRCPGPRSPDTLVNKLIMSLPA
jgi:hypothetical protein